MHKRIHIYTQVCSKCGDKYTPVTIARPHNLQLNNGLCLLCQCRLYVDLDEKLQVNAV